VTEAQVLDAFETMIKGQWALAYLTPDDELGIGNEDICV
jgi:hypothetical protein